MSSTQVDTDARGVSATSRKLPRMDAEAVRRDLEQAANDVAQRFAFTRELPQPGDVLPGVGTVVEVDGTTITIAQEPEPHDVTIELVKRLPAGSG